MMAHAVNIHHVKASLSRASLINALDKACSQREQQQDDTEDGHDVHYVREATRAANSISPLRNRL